MGDPYIKNVYFCQGLTAGDISEMARAGIGRNELVEMSGVSSKEVSEKLQVVIEGMIKDPDFDNRSRALMVLINLQGACRDNPGATFAFTDDPMGPLSPMWPPDAKKNSALPVEKESET